MSETPRDQRGLWSEVSRSFEELGEALRVHLSADAARSPSDPTADSDPVDSAPAAESAGRSTDPWSEATAADADSSVPAGAGPSRPGGVGLGPTAGTGPGPVTPETGTTPTPDPAAPTSAGTEAGSGARTGASDAGAQGTATAGSGGGRWSSGRFATNADWESARESVRDLGRNAQRIAAQAGDAARDPQVRDSAQRAARSLGDAIVTTVEDFATDLRNRMRNPRWSDADRPRPAERPPIAPVDDDPNSST